MIAIAVRIGRCHYNDAQHRRTENPERCTSRPANYGGQGMNGALVKALVALVLQAQEDLNRVAYGAPGGFSCSRALRSAARASAISLYAT
jgi:hypothetical protein